MGRERRVHQSSALAASISRPRLRRHLIGLESQLMGLIRCSCGVWGRVTPIIFRSMRIINVACQRKMRTAHIDFGSVMAALPWLLLMLSSSRMGSPWVTARGCGRTAARLTTASAEPFFNGVIHAVVRCAREKAIGQAGGKTGEEEAHA